MRGCKTARVTVLVKAANESEAGFIPPTEPLEAMDNYNEELANTGTLLAGNGLRPSSAGRRVAFDGSNRTVFDGPFEQTSELVARFRL